MITGGFGFLGEHVVDRLCDRFSIMICDCNLRERTRAGTQCDITDFDSLQTLFDATNPDYVVHLAAITGVERCRLLPRETFSVNVAGTFNVAYLSARYKSKLVFASSREVYGESSDGKKSEEATLGPANLYGMTKMLGESIIKWMRVTTGLRYVILRFTNLYGPGGDNYAVSKITRKAVLGEDIPLFGGQQVLNLIHVRDAAHAVDVCLTRPDIDCEIFNIGSNETISVSDLVHRIISLCNSNSRIISFPMRAGDITSFEPDLTKAHRITGFVADVSLDEGLSSCVNHYKSFVHRK